MKLTDLAKELKISTESLKRFIQDFDIEIKDSLNTNFEVTPSFEKFVRENIEFLLRYEKDLEHKKSVADIADKINQPKEKVEELLNEQLPKIFDNGIYKSTVSSFGIDNQLGGNYHFVYDYFGNKTELTQRDFIGYRDLFFLISDALEPFINKEEAENWGIAKPAGIILYGPPGSGKIFWANKIAQIINYQFREVKKHYYGISFVNGQKTNFNDFLMQMMKDEKVLLFMEDFDEVMSQRNDENSVSSINEETKEIILQYINRFEAEDLLMVGSANSLHNIDSEILAPGRFDVLIPVFPPNAKERAEMILFSMTKNLEKDALLYKILERNNADHLPFWNSTAEKMKAFSNTMMLDFTQSLKKRIRNLYHKTKNENLRIDQNLLNNALRDASAKLTEEYLNQIQQFIYDVSVNNVDDFSRRLRNLQQELDAYKIEEKPRRQIGFQHNDHENEDEE